MSDETKQLILAAAVLIMQSYAVEPWKYPVFAWFWDWIAKVTGILANVLGHVSITARHNYFVAVNDGA